MGDQNDAERTNALAAEAIADWPVEKKGESFASCKLGMQRDDGTHDNDELRIFRNAAERNIKDALRKAIRQAAYERRDEIEKLKRKLCAYEEMEEDILHAENLGDVNHYICDKDDVLKKIDAEPVATLE